jgi:uncharacterized protein
MISIGQHHRLSILKRSEPGCFLDGQNLGKILLPKRYCSDDWKSGDEVDVFIYRDSEDRLIATTETPKTIVNQCAYLKVIAISKPGAFLDWGLPKDLLLPYNQQQIPVEEGYSYVVYTYLDESSDRIVASTRLEDHLKDYPSDLEKWQAVEVQIYGKSDLGFKAVIEDRYLGQLYDNEVFQKLYFGQTITAYIKQVRSDGKIDLSLQLPTHRIRESLADQILSHLKENGGESNLTDKSSPEKVYEQFSVSKSRYKKALGLLYKSRQIVIEKNRIILTPDQPKEI